MSYPPNTGLVLAHIGYDPLTDFFARASTPGGPVELTWNHSDPKPTEQEVADAELAATKAAKLKTIRAEAQAIIIAKWPLWRQVNAVGGIYPQATQDEMDADIVSVIEASNTAEAAVTAATTVADVEAVAATWPVI